MRDHASFKVSGTLVFNTSAAVSGNGNITTADAGIKQEIVAEGIEYTRDFKNTGTPTKRPFQHKQT